MRNILEFPPTKEEYKEALEEAANNVSYEKTKLIGDIRPLLFRKLLENLDEIYSNQFGFYGIHKDWNDTDKMNNG